MSATRTFREAVEACETPVGDAYRPGLRGLGRYSRRVRCSDPRRFTGSLSLEETLAESHPNEPLWDYGIGFRRDSTEVAIWIEVHPADTSQVRNVLDKLRGLKGWLEMHAPALGQLTDRTGWGYVWTATSGVHIRPGSRQARLLSKSGIKGPMRCLKL